MARVNYERMAPTYDAGRAVPLTELEPWRKAVAPHVSVARPVLDVGSGTGIFSEAFATWFSVDVIAIEPSTGMRSRATRDRPNPLVQHLGATAEHLPLREASCGTAWLSTVIHHFADLNACAIEVRRAVGPDGVVLIRSAFAGRLDHIRLFHYFPEARQVAETFPSVDSTVSAFALAGFEPRALTRVDQVWAPSLHAYAERVRIRADTTLVALTDDEFAAGMRRLEAEAAQETDPQPVADGLDLLVLGPRQQ
jgi:ubiquinone/menaquinone biosynthesis C-methylase UbiE